jgi:hypothetical protein
VSAEELILSMIKTHGAALRRAIDPTYSDAFDCGMLWVVENAVSTALGMGRAEARDYIERNLMERV